MRVGFGYDCHALIPGDHVMIGGVNIPFSKGIKAHSDGDVLLHAIGDALLGAVALGDLGTHFPDDDPAYKNASSSRFLEEIIAMLQAREYRVSNVDATVITERPKLAPYIASMRHHIARLLAISVSQVSVKATRNEKMGWIGAGDGLAAHAVVLCYSR